MALIDLTLINELRLRALSLKRIAQASCYNQAGHELDSSLFVGYMKAYFQAYNLAKQLEALRDICVRYAEGRIAFRSAECDSQGEFLDKTVGTESEGFGVLHRFFAAEGPDDLPAQIEQYAELLRYVTNVVSIPAGMRTNFEAYAPNEVFTGVDRNGELVFTADPNLDLTSRHAMVRALPDCLLHYNEFFALCRSTIEANTVAGVGSLKETANLILDLMGITTYHAKTTLCYALD